LEGSHEKLQEKEEDEEGENKTKQNGFLIDVGPHLG